MKRNQIYIAVILYALFMNFSVISKAQVRYEKGDVFFEGKLWYRVTSVSPPEVEVTTKNSSAPYWDNEAEKPSGRIEVPETVRGMTVTAIGDYAFSETNVSSLHLPATVTRLGSYAFYRCNSLFFLNIDGVELIDEATFAECKILNEVSLPSVKVIWKDAFARCPDLSKVYIGRYALTIFSTAFNECKFLSKISVHPENERFYTFDNILFNKKETSLLLYPNYKSEHEYRIPEGVTAIGAHAINNKVFLKTLYFPTTLILLNDSALRDCRGLTRLVSYEPEPNHFQLNDNVFGNIDYEKCELVVPFGTEEKYRNAAQWKKFKYIIGGSNVKVKELDPSGLRIYPNPSRGEYWIELPWEDARLCVYRETGEIVFTQSLKKGKNRLYIDTPGVYMLRIETGEGQITRKLVVHP